MAVGFGSVRCWILCIVIGQCVISAYLILMYICKLGTILQENEPLQNSNYTETAANKTSPPPGRCPSTTRSNETTTATAVTKLIIQIAGHYVLIITLIVLQIVENLELDFLKTIMWILCIFTSFMSPFMSLLVKIRSKPCDGSNKIWFRVFIIRGMVGHSLGLITCIVALIWALLTSVKSIFGWIGTTSIIAAAVQVPEMSLETIAVHWAEHNIYKIEYLVANGLIPAALWYGCGVCFHFLPLVLEFKKQRLEPYWDWDALWRWWSSYVWVCWVTRVLVIIIVAGVDLKYRYLNKRKYSGYELTVDQILCELSVPVREVTYALFYDGTVLLITKFRWERMTEERNRR